MKLAYNGHSDKSEKTSNLKMCKNMNISVSNMHCRLQGDHDITEIFEKQAVEQGGYYVICST